MEHGTWNTEHGTWNMEHGTLNTASGDSQKHVDVACENVGKCGYLSSGTESYPMGLNMGIKAARLLFR